MPYLIGDEKSQCIAFLAISSLGNTELAANLAKLYPTDGAISALTAIARFGDEGDRGVAADALKAISKNREAVVYVQLQVESEDRTAIPEYGQHTGLLVTSDGYVAVVDPLSNTRNSWQAATFSTCPRLSLHRMARHNRANSYFPPTHPISVSPYIRLKGITLRLSLPNHHLRWTNLCGSSKTKATSRIHLFRTFPCYRYVEKIEDHYLTVAVLLELTTSPKQHRHLPVGSYVLNKQGQIVGLNITEMGQSGNTVAHVRHIVYIRTDRILALLKESGARP